MVTTKRARTDVVVTSLAFLLTLGTLAAPASSYLMPAARVLACGLTAGWFVLRLVALHHTLVAWRAWRHNVSWTLTPLDLEAYHD